MKRFLLMLGGAVVALATWTAPAGACGGLVAPNGAVHLLQTTTLAAWHRGIEHYVTSFRFAGGGAEFGSIVPLPAVPLSVEAGGDWTLQRLEREAFSQAAGSAIAGSASAGAAGSAQVILETKIEALDITVLKGGGQAVGQWAQDHGFLLTPDAPELLDYYSRHSQVFLAARFDTQAAEDRGQQVGDGTPVHITMRLRHPWVPLRILGLGRGADESINAHVFLLTDTKPIVQLPPGATVERSVAADRLLLSDLRADKGMGWVPRSMWLTFVGVNGSPAQLRSDITTRWLPPPPPPTTQPVTTTTTVPPATTVPPTTVVPTTDVPLIAAPVAHHESQLPLTVPAVVLLLAAAGSVWIRLRRRWR